MATSRKPNIEVFEREWFYLAFSGLDARNHKVTSEATPEVRNPPRPYYVYNCMALVVGDETKVWWPGGRGYWPRQPSEDTIAELMSYLADLGYKECQNGDFEDGIRKVAIFADENNTPLHVAIQPQYTGSSSRRWKSKMGNNVNIEHELSAVECNLYGKAVKFMYKTI